MPPLSPQQQENLPKLKQLRQGTGTGSVWRNVGNFGGTQMACGMGFLSDYFKDHFVALPTTLYRSGELCGGCVRLWCVDSVCQDALVRNASFMVTDSCKDCTGNSLLVSERGFTNLTGVNINISPTLQIAWTFESCAPLISGGIRMLASKNNGPTFLSCNFSNLRQLLKTVTIGGIPFTRTAYGAWELNSPGRDIAIPKTGAELVLTSVDGQRISKRLRTLGSQDLGINFN
ncbi:Expansin 1 [Chlorella sorokiniana]|uniref:Expansin 1 n=1 Tax=Chlorella sorokiniana TaxID=3076 RepID=A0A2P6TUL5_CHLSO|nr:Expansin 1 [Chlorella sorokiniana]|eukprot:PRW57741.1 Expansin 1 [Chlorella sorokiniana]